MIDGKKGIEDLLWATAEAFRSSSGSICPQTERPDFLSSQAFKNALRMWVEPLGSGPSFLPRSAFYSQLPVQFLGGEPSGCIHLFFPLSSSRPLLEQPSEGSLVAPHQSHTCQLLDSAFQADYRPGYSAYPEEGCKAVRRICGNCCLQYYSGLGNNCRHYCP